MITFPRTEAVLALIERIEALPPGPGKAAVEAIFAQEIAMYNRPHSEVTSHPGRPLEQVKHKTVIKVGVSQTKLDRTLALVNTLGEHGVTATDLNEICDEDLKDSMSNYLGILYRTGRLQRREVVDKDRSGANRDLWKYYPLNVEPA